MKRLLLSAGLLSLIAGTCAQDGTFSFDGQYRPRFELRNGFKTPITENTEAAAFTEQRTRINANYKAKKYAFKMSIQDIRIWGETGQINKSDQLLSAHEAYADYYMGSKSTLRIGRQEMAYDGDRFIGTLGWAAQARAFDAVRYMFKDTVGNEFHAMFSWNQSGFGSSAPEPAKLTGNAYTTGGGGNTSTIFNLPLPKAQQMIWYKKTFKSGDVSVMVNNDLLEAAATNSTHAKYTIGVTPNLKFGPLKTGGQFYYTGGELNETTTYSGYMFNLYAQLPKVFSSPMIGMDYISGDDNSTGDVIEGWSPSYGTNHAYYGWMDYFYVGNGHGGANENSAGLVDIFLKTTFKFGEESKLLGHFHYFASTAERTNTATGETYQGGLGSEIDLVFVNSLTKGVTLKVGYSQMFGVTDVMKTLKAPTVAPDNYNEQGMQSWAWVMIDFTPKFL